MVRRGIEGGRNQLHLGIRVEVREVDDRRRPDGLVRRKELVGQFLESFAALGSEAAGRLAAVREVDTPQKRRDDLAELAQHHLGVRTGLRQWMCPHPHQQRLIGLTGPVDAEVR